jgi:hypothetical protein
MKAGHIITDAMLAAAAQIDDLDEALRSVMDQVGITSGDVAGVVFSGSRDAEWWAVVSSEDRLRQLGHWRDVEQGWGDEEAS